MTGEGREPIAPGRAPGGLWVRITAGGAIAREYPLLPGDEDRVEREAEADGTIAVTAVASGSAARLQIYDGDTGECLHAVTIRPE